MARNKTKPTYLKRRDPIFIQLLDAIAEYRVEWLAEEAEVSMPCLYLWLNGKTRRPHLQTVIKVAKAIGWKLTWEKGTRTGTPLLKLVK